MLGKIQAYSSLSVRCGKAFAKRIKRQRQQKVNHRHHQTSSLAPPIKVMDPKQIHSSRTIINGDDDDDTEDEDTFAPQDNDAPPIPPVDQEAIQRLEATWKEHPALNQPLIFDTWKVPSESVHKLIRHASIQPHLPYTSINNSNNDEDEDDEDNILHHVVPRIKMVQDYVPIDHAEANGDDESLSKKYKLILRSLSSMEPVSSSIDDTLKEVLTQFNATDGPAFVHELSPSNLSFQYILSRILPIPPPTAYEQVGHVAHFNLKPYLMPYAKVIGSVLVQTHPTIETAVTKVGTVSGPYRTFPLLLMAGRNQTETIHSEHGLKLFLNVATCYWCTRLSGERQVLLQIIQKRAKKNMEEPLVVADVFCGIGALCLLAHRDAHCRILANDWNPEAMKYFSKNIQANGLKADNFELSCQDSFDFLLDLGSVEHQYMDEEDEDGPVPGVEYDALPDHIVMNYPVEAPKFLGALRFWSTDRLEAHWKRTGRLPRFHVYTFARADKEEIAESVASGKKTRGGRRKKRKLRGEEDVAVDLVANALLPPLVLSSPGFLEEELTWYRRQELDQEYQANVNTRIVRNVAPGKLVVCVEFSLTPKLLRHIQGDYDFEDDDV